MTWESLTTICFNIVWRHLWFATSVTINFLFLLPMASSWWRGGQLLHKKSARRKSEYSLSCRLKGITLFLLSEVLRSLFFSYCILNFTTVKDRTSHVAIEIVRYTCIVEFGFWWANIQILIFAQSTFRKLFESLLGEKEISETSFAIPFGIAKGWLCPRNEGFDQKATSGHYGKTILEFFFITLFRIVKWPEISAVKSVVEKIRELFLFATQQPRFHLCNRNLVTFTVSC